MKLNFNKFSSAFSGMIGLPPDESSELVGVYSLYHQAPASRPNILVYGHDQDFRLLLRTFLEIQRFNVKEADSVEEVVIKTQIERPDLILMDAKFIFSLTLSELNRMRKYEYLRKIPFILLSGHAQKDVRRRALLTGAAELLVKPLNYERLEQILKSHLFLSPHFFKLENFL